MKYLMHVAFAETLCILFGLITRQTIDWQFFLITIIISFIWQAVTYKK